MNKGKFMKSLLFSLLLLLVLTSCDNFFKTEDQLDMEERQQEIYAMYKEAKGSEALSYDEWIASIAGKDGIGIKTIDAVKQEGKTTITVTLDDGTTKVFTIEDGVDGTNGIDGVGIDDIETITANGITTIIISLTDGTSKSFDVISGANGVNGNGIKNIETSEGENATILTITLDDGTTKEIVLHNGANGVDGTDGVGIDTITSTKDGGVTTVTIKLTDGSSQTFTVVDGTNGTNGNGIKDITTSQAEDSTKLVITLDDGTTKEIILYNGTNGADGVGIESVVSTKNGTVTTVTVTLTNKETTSFEINDGAVGATGSSAYELYLKYHPEYAGSEEMWVEDLVNGKLGNDYVENSTCLVTLTVSDVSGNLLTDALVEANGYKYLTSKEGKVQILTGAKDFTYSISKAGYKSVVKTINAIDMVEKELSLTETLTPLANLGYIVRNENSILNQITTLENDAYHYWYFSYEPTGIKIIVDVVDDEITSSSDIVGMNDNVEFILQKNSTDDSLSPYNSFNVLVTLGNDSQNWARFAQDYSSYGENIYNDLLNNKLMKVQKSYKNKNVDGYNGMTVTFWLDYSLWDINYSNALGNMTVLVGGRNNDLRGNTLFRYFVNHQNIWNYANTSSRILADGKLVNNYYDLPDIEQDLLLSSAYVPNTSLANDMAVLSSNNGLVREFIVGAQLFTDRDYMLHDDALLAALNGKSYFRNSLDATQMFTVLEAGYVVVAVPATGNFSVSNTSYLLNNGFELLAQNLPVLGYKSTGGFMNEEMNYFVKWCEAEETYELNKWAIVIFESSVDYEEDTWIKTSGIVIKLDTREMKEKYAPTTRLWQGIPGITSVTTSSGTRLWASWFTGSTNEPRVGNYAVYYYSDDDGKNWVPAFVATFDYDVINDSRLYDPSIFTDDDNNLYLWWNQTNYSFSSGSVWYCKINNADQDFSQMVAETPICTGPGLKLNKPIILSTGEWIYCAHDMRDRTSSNVYSSIDDGQTWTLKGTAAINNGNAFFEPTIVEVLDDNSEEVTLMMWNRCTESYMISISYSYDGGKTWTSAKEFVPTGNLYTGPSSRANSLNFTYEGQNYIAYAQHYNTESRNNIAIYLSNDGGKTFNHALILDTNSGVAYPDIRFVDGYLYVVWDYNRYNEKRLLMAKLSVDELMAIEGVETLDRNRIQVISSLTTTGLTLNVGGRVFDEMNNPLANVTVMVGGYEVLTDEDGYYYVKNVSASDVEIVIQKTGYIAQVIKLNDNMIINSEFNYYSDINLAINPQYVDLSGRFVDIYGNAITDATVLVNDVEIQTDNDGSFIINDLFADEKYTSFMLEVHKEGYAVLTQEVAFSLFNSGNDYAYDLGDVKVLPENTTVLGVVGGKQINSSKNVPEYEVYLVRTDDAIVIKSLTTSTLTTSGVDRLEFFFNVYNYSTKGRGAQTVLFNIFSSGLIRGWNWPNNIKATLFSEGKVNVSYKGVTINNTVTISQTGINEMQFTIPYAFFDLVAQQQFELEYGSSYTNFYDINKYKVDASTVIGFSMLAGYKESNTWYADAWQYNDIPDLKDENIGTEVYKNYPSDMAIITPDNHVMKNYASYSKYVLDSKENLFKAIESTHVYKPGVSVQDNMAGIDANAHVLKKFAAGQYLFSDRTTHAVPNDGGIKAINGMSFVYDSVTGSDPTITITSSGYLMMMVDDNSLTKNSSSKWTFVLRSSVTNHGVQAASGTVSLYVLWVEVGDVVTIPANALVFTNK